MLASLIKGTPEKAAAQVEKFAAEYDAAAERLASARSAYGVALVDEADGLIDGKAVSAIRHELAELESNVAAKAAALVEARRRHQNAVAIGRGEALAGEWSAAAAIAAKRHKAALKLAAASQAYGDAYKGLLQATAELNRALPANPDPAAALTMQADIDRIAQLELWRNGFTLAISWPYGKDQITSLAERYEDATAAVEAWATPHRH